MEKKDYEYRVDSYTIESEAKAGIMITRDECGEDSRRDLYVEYWNVHTFIRNFFDEYINWCKKNNEKPIELKDG